MEKILVVEDEKYVRENIVELLTCEGYNCLVAEDGLSAINVLSKELPDLILTDLLMPRLNGFELYKMFKEMEIEKNIPFIFLTAKNDDETLNYAMQLGADDFLVKPYKAENLLQRIKTRLLKQQVIDLSLEKLKTSISLYVPHELRTPLIAVLGYSELLMNDFNHFTDSEKIEMIGSIHNAGLRFQNRIEKFINYTEYKLGNYIGKSDDYINTKDVKCVKKLEKCFECKERINDIKLSLEHANLKISLHDFEIMMQESLENACKYSPKGTPIEVIGEQKKELYQISIKNMGNKISTKNIHDFSIKSDFLSSEITWSMNGWIREG